MDLTWPIDFGVNLGYTIISGFDLIWTQVRLRCVEISVDLTRCVFSKGIGVTLTKTHSGMFD